MRYKYTLTDHVTNKNLSIKLKEAGFEQKSEFYWHDGELYKNGECIGDAPVDYFTPTRKSISAFLATELLMWLPSDLTIKKMKCGLSITPMITDIITKTKVYVVDYGFYSLDVLERVFEKQVAAFTLQDALGEMLLYLKKEGLIKK
jgi:hypothetical protein